ncbi:MAG TPA: hypothetical protein VL098_04265 [Flavipsychrobacter sp.]|nr:hypothetical protein [Flavipsychrobacter sp.]
MERNHFPNVLNETIQRILNKESIFYDVFTVSKYVESFKDKYTVFDKHNQWGENSFVMWIYDYNLTVEEIEKGYLGNYARISIKEMPGEVYYLEIEKLQINGHPKMKRPLRITPDSGDPILRDIDKRIGYNSFNDAYSELKRLHEKYPKAAILKPEKLFIKIYSRSKSTEAVRIIDHELDIELSNGKYYIIKKLNERTNVVYKNKVDEFVFTTFINQLSGIRP